MRVLRAIPAQVLIVLLALLLTACPAQQQPQRSETADATPEATVEETEEPEDTDEPEDTEEPEDTDEPGDTDEPDGDDDDDDDDDGYVTIRHDDAEMKVDVPESWTDLELNDLWTVDNEENTGYSMAASPDLDSFMDLEFEVPGVFFAASELLVGELTPEELLDEYSLADCDFEGRDEYSDPAYTGVQDLYTNCGGTDAQFLFITAEADDGSHMVLVQVSAITDEDLEALDRILATFLAGDIPELP